MLKIPPFLPLIASMAAFATSCASNPSRPADVSHAPAAAVYHTFRLRPGEDLSPAIQTYVVANSIHAGSVVTVVGSLTQAAIRFANQPQATVVKRDWEIVSLTGTVSINGSHLHLAVSGPQGETSGGHLMEGSLVRTTAEVTLVELRDRDFTRELDPKSGYQELVITPRAP